MGAILVVVACGEPRAASAVDAGAPDAAPILDPALFDCTSIGPDGQRRPDRASPVAAACALDPTCTTHLVAGHRGAGGELGRIAPEDTLAAYRAAIALGIELVETDPRPTADGVLVNLHDDTVDRTTDGGGAVDDLTLAEIQSLAIEAGGLPGDFSCERVPTLTEIIRLCRDRAVVLVDANKTDRVDLLVAAIQEADAIDWAIFDTSSVAKIDQALAIEPALHVQIRPGSVAEIGEQLDHLAPRLPVIVELRRADRAAGSAVVHGRGTRAFSDVFIEDATAIATGSLDGYAAVIDDGVDILQTDRPDLVLELLRRRGLRP